jgi:hypothetical protein
MLIKIITLEVVVERRAAHLVAVPVVAVEAAVAVTSTSCPQIRIDVTLGLVRCSALTDIRVRLSNIHMNHSIQFRTLISTLILSLCVTLCFGQKLEIRPAVYSGVFFFRGSGATSTSTIRGNDVVPYYNATSYGKESDFSYAVELQGQWVTKQNHVFGLGIAYEHLATKSTVDSVYGDLPHGSPASGTVTLTNTYFTVSPFLGHRFSAGPVSFDALVGIDFAFNLNAREEAKLSSPIAATYELEKDFHPNDLRLRIQVNTYYKRMGLDLGYSLGTRNLYFYDNPAYQHKTAYANFIRVGLSYRIN